MSLVAYQQTLVDEIYEAIVDGSNRNIQLYGSPGSGKSTIVKGVLDSLQEGWFVLCIEGINPALGPYLTWYSGASLHPKSKLNLGGKVSFGLNILPAPISVGVMLNPQISQQSYFLNQNEEAILSSIKEQADPTPNILIVADDYELWDIPSKQLLQKILLPQLKLLSDLQVTVLFVLHDNTLLEDVSKGLRITIPGIQDDEVIAVLRQRGYSGSININDVRLCAGNNLSLALMAASYFEESNTEVNEFCEILDRRYETLSLESQNACKILEPLSVIDSYFTTDETAFFIDSNTQYREDIKLQAEKCLEVAQKNLFITEGKSCYFSFTDEKVKEYFKTRIWGKEKYYHHKFAEYLKKRHPEDYFSRGHHLKLALSKNDTKNTIEAWQLLFLAYIRRAAETNNVADIYHIQPDIAMLIEQLEPDNAEENRQVLSKLLTGYKAFLYYEYKSALECLQQISFSMLIPACLAEVQRLILLCQIQLVESLSMIHQNADELYGIINAPDFIEDEQYCQAALVLMDAYIDRSNDKDKVQKLRQRYRQIIQQHLDCPVFKGFEANDDRKAALYFSATVALNQTGRSVNYYRKSHNRTELYKALCNHSGNAIVSSNYQVAKQALEECFIMLKDNSIRYPSQYKIENNRILLNYLLAEQKASGDEDKMLKAAQTAVSAYSCITKSPGDEVSHVMSFNYLGLSILCDTCTWQAELSEANMLMYEMDEYYQYFLHDLNLASAVLQGNKDVARLELELLKKLDVPLLSSYKRILAHRRSVQERILNDSTCAVGSPFEYHKVIATACSRIQDKTCSFFGRGFLLSDLQFLSF